MKIIYLLDDTLDKSDGVQQCVVTLGEYFRSNGHEVHYFVADTKRADIDNVHSLVRFVSLKFNGNSVRTPLFASKSQIKTLLDSIKPDVVHVQMPYSPLFSSRVLGMLDSDVTVVGTWHTFPTGTLQRISHRLLSFALRSSLKRFEATIGVSKPTALFADAIYGTRSIVIPNAVDISRFKLHQERPLYDIVYLGRFDSRKGPMHLLRALVELKKVYPLFSQLSVVMGGSGPDLEKCKSYAVDNHLKIEFTGYVPEEQKPQFLSSARLSVFPSTGGEAFGISVVEAMASGSSIVLAGDNDGYRSILADKPELLIDPKNSKVFASKLIHYLELDEQEAFVKKSWLKKSAEQYDVAVVAKELERIYTA